MRTETDQKLLHGNVSLFAERFYNTMTIQDNYSQQEIQTNNSKSVRNMQNFTIKMLK